MKRQLTIALLSMTMLAGNAYAESAVPLISGGVGEAERAVIDQNEDTYNLKLVYTGEGGMYLSDVNVVIKDSKGNEVVNSVTQGPMLLTDLKPGKYTVESSAEGFSKKQTVQLGANLKTIQVSFPIKDDDNPAAGLSASSEVSANNPNHILGTLTR